MRTRLVVAAALATVGIAAALAWSASDPPSTDPPARVSTPSPSSRSPSPTPSPQRAVHSEAEPVHGRLVIWARGDLTPEFADAVAGLDDVLVEEIRSLVPPDLRARIVELDAEDDGRRRGPLVLSLPEVKRRFGEFAFRPRSGTREVDLEPGFRDEHIVTVEVPLLGNVTCHEAIVDDLRAALRTVVDAGLVSEIDPSRYGGCFYPRRISVADDGLSRHSWGIAIDINVDLSHPDLGPPPHPDVVAAFEAHGFRWGGDFLHPDNHHFEWVGDVQPLDR